MAVTEPTTNSASSAARVPSEGGSPLNLPNIITLSRLLLSLVLFAMIGAGEMWIASAAVFVVAVSTDYFDGYIARKYGLITKVGRILDPFVDKVIVIGAFVFLLAVPASGVTEWMTMAVIGREMFVTSLRSFLESEGKDFSAVWSGKVKMVLQCVAVTASLLSLSDTVTESQWSGEFQMLRDVLLRSAVAVTLYSGYVYVVRAISLFRRPSAP